LNISHKKN